MHNFREVNQGTLSPIPADILAWNATSADRFDTQSLAQLFEAVVERMPDEPAAIIGNRSINYGDLNARANQLAHALRARGVSAESNIGISTERSFEMLTAVIAVVKAGGAYVPFDPALPRERLGYMIEDAQPELILTEAALVSTLAPQGSPLLALDLDWPAIARESSSNPSPAPVGDAPVYVTYTSGSTGKPKGIVMTQRPLLNLLGWMLRTYVLPTRARTLQFASLSFDVSFQELFSTLLTGGTLVLITDDERRDLGGLAEVIHRQRINRIFLPALALQQLAEGFCNANAVSCRDLRNVITAGEQLIITDSIRQMFTTLTECRLHNEYGPSETHVVTALPLPASPKEWTPRPAIGKPIANTQIHILNPGGNPSLVGIPGELHIGGISLARGYLGRPDLTASKFIRDPFSNEPDARLYRTGDQARWLLNGDLEFLGRLDDQIKIRGYRVEPADVETALQAHPDLREACVMTRVFDDGEQRLVGYFVSGSTAPPSVGDLRTFLAIKLPDYMIPGSFIRLDAFPLNANGKLDRRALPLPETTRPALSCELIAPRSDLEHTIAAIWRDVLRLSEVGVQDNFFELGGNSILLVQVHQRLKQQLRRELAIVALFQYPTIEGMAKFLDETGAPSRTTGTVDRAARQREAQSRQQALATARLR